MEHIWPPEAEGRGSGTDGEAVLLTIVDVVGNLPNE
jgi:hypothetical protein